MSEFSNLSSLKLLRSVDLLSRLTILQLSHIADSLSVVSFSDGRTIINKVFSTSCFCLHLFVSFNFSETIMSTQSLVQNEHIDGLYVIQKGQVEIKFNSDVLKSHHVSSLIPDSASQDGDLQDNLEMSIQKTEGSYFGEWALVGEELRSINVTAIGDVTCAVLSKEVFDAVVGPLTKLSQNDQKYVFSFCRYIILNSRLISTVKLHTFVLASCRTKDISSELSKDYAQRVDVSKLSKVQLSDLVKFYL